MSSYRKSFSLSNGHKEITSSPPMSKKGLISAANMCFHRQFRMRHFVSALCMKLLPPENISICLDQIHSPPHVFLFGKITEKNIDRIERMMFSTQYFIPTTAKQYWLPSYSVNELAPIQDIN